MGVMTAKSVLVGYLRCQASESSDPLFVHRVIGTRLLTPVDANLSSPSEEAHEKTDVSTRVWGKNWCCDARMEKAADVSGSKIHTQGHGDVRNRGYLQTSLLTPKLEFNR
jgi:hypothetical protein